jgi:signal transduction histidine kinase
LTSRNALAASNAELERRNDELIAAQHAQRELMGFIVHDLKTPLTTVFLSLDYGARHVAKGDQDLGDALRDALTSAHRVKAMIDDLLAVTLLEESRMTLRREAIPVAVLVDAAVAQCSRSAADKRIAIAVELGRNLRIDGDRGLLIRVLAHILERAVRFSPADSRIAIDASGEPGVNIAVSCDGPAIAIPDRARVFDKFARDITWAAGGLGLYFCRRAVEAHHGDIRVVERPGWATSFQVWLPSPAEA